eukprot:Skav220256  [mRNA]  locus=scaffold1696:355474:358919:- [translate_table: standard]
MGMVQHAVTQHEEDQIDKEPGAAENELRSHQTSPEHISCPQYQRVNCDHWIFQVHDVLDALGKCSILCHNKVLDVIVGASQSIMCQM